MLNPQFEHITTLASTSDPDYRIQLIDSIRTDPFVLINLDGDCLGVLVPCLIGILGDVSCCFMSDDKGQLVRKGVIDLMSRLPLCDALRPWTPMLTQALFQGMLL